MQSTALGVDDPSTSARSDEMTTAARDNQSSAALLSDDTTTIVVAVCASVGGVLLISLIVACAVKRSRKSKANAPTEMTTTRDTENEVEPEPKRESHYHSAAPLAANVRSLAAQTESSLSEDDQQSAYDGPPASAAADLPQEQSPKPPARKVSKQKNKRSTQAPTESLEPKSLRTRATDVVQIPIEEIEIGKELGAGSFGVVFKGTWGCKAVAIKQVNTSSVVSDKKAIAIADFEAEVSQMASTGYHENLVQLYGVTTLESGDLAAVVEFCGKGDLMDALYGKKVREWTVSEQFSVAHGAACGVTHLHRQGVIHRDIAARNVLLAGKRDLIAKLADFGMSRLLTESVYDEQQTVNAVGPLRWMAPEQMERRAYSRASDVFAFGVLLFEIFKRELPWQGVPNFIAAAKIMNGERMDVSSHDIPRQVAALMLECWAGEPDKRPSMKHVQRVLQDSAPSSDESVEE